jgi:hypothetical protein
MVEALMRGVNPSSLRRLDPCWSWPMVAEGSEGQSQQRNAERMAFDIARWLLLFSDHTARARRSL